MTRTKKSETRNEKQPSEEIYGSVENKSVLVSNTWSDGETLIEDDNDDDGDNRQDGDRRRTGRV